MSYNKFDRIPGGEQESSIIKKSGDFQMNDNNSGRDILMENTSANNSLRFSMDDQNSIRTTKPSSKPVQIIQRHQNKILYVGIGVLFLINLIINCHNRSLINNLNEQVQVPRSQNSEGQSGSSSGLENEITELKSKIESIQDSLKYVVQKKDYDSTIRDIRNVENLSAKVNQNERLTQKNTQDLQNLKKVTEDMNKERNEVNENINKLDRITKDNTDALKRAEDGRLEIRNIANNASQKSQSFEAGISKLKEQMNNQKNNLENAKAEIEDVKRSLGSAKNSAKDLRKDFDDFKYKETQSTGKLNTDIGGLKNTKKEVLSSVNSEREIHQEFADRVQIILKKVAESLQIDKNSDEYPFIGVSQSQNDVIKDLIEANESCLHPQDISGSITECHASSKREPCENAIDGILKSRTSNSEWTTNGEQNPWITLVFKNKVRVRALKVLQKYEERGAAVRVNVTMNDGVTVVSRFSATSSREWNVIKLPKSVSTDMIKITIIEANWGNNGFKEIKVQGCEACIDNI